VIAALATGFYLIPNFGIFRLTLATGSLLMFTALIGFALDRKIAAATAATVLIVASSFLFINSSFEHIDPAKGLIAIEQSPYAELRVLDQEDSRYLLIDGGIHTIADTATWRSYFHYAAVMDLPKYFFNKPGSMLLIGIGGGSLVKQYAKDDWKVDAVDIDPKVIKFARTYFSLFPSEGNVVEMDGRKYLSSTTNYYDVILLDAFGSSEIPFHLVTKEVFSLIASRLNNDGIFALNVEAIGWDDPIVKTLIATMKQAFTDVIALPQEEPPTKLGNIILMASKKKLVPLREPERNELLDPDWRYSPAYQKVHAWDNRYTTDTTGVQILTDDLNPVDIRAEQINLAARVDLHKYFQKTGVSW
jgi:spermidine synthase